MSDTKLEVITFKKTVLLKYDHRESVLHLKEKLFMDADIGVEPEKQRLYYLGTRLEDFRTLGSYKISPEQYTVVMVYDLKDHHTMKQRTTRKTKHLKYYEEAELLSSDESTDDSRSRKLRTLSATFAELKNYTPPSTARCSNAEYSTFEGYRDDPLFISLVQAMNKPTNCVNEVEDAVEKLIDKDHNVLDLIYENLAEFLELCAEPEKIGDVNKKFK